MCAKCVPRSARKVCAGSACAECSSSLECQQGVMALCIGDMTLSHVCLDLAVAFADMMPSSAVYQCSLLERSVHSVPPHESLLSLSLRFYVTSTCRFKAAVHTFLYDSCSPPRLLRPLRGTRPARRMRRHRQPVSWDVPARAWRMQWHELQPAGAHSRCAQAANAGQHAAAVVGAELAHTFVIVMAG